MLMRARKHGLLTFEGEMLFQRRDDHVLVELLQPITEIRKAAGLPPVDPREYHESLVGDDNDETV